MSISDEDLVRQLESVPMVDGPDLRDGVMERLRVEDRRSRLSRQAGLPVLHFRPRLYLGLAWAAAVVIVVGIAFQRASGPRPQNAAATMAAAPGELTVHRIGDRFAVQSTVKGELDWDRAKLSKVEVLSDGTVILQRRKGASGTAFIRLTVAGREVQKTAINVNPPTF